MRAYLLDEALALRLKVERANAGTGRSGRKHITETDVTDWAAAEGD